MSQSIKWVHYQDKLPTETKETNKANFKRRSHEKSRGGCLVCKKRRVKCDEKHPFCSRCLSGSRACKYASTLPKIGPEESMPIQLSATPTLATSINRLLDIPSQPPSTFNIKLLQYFHSHTITTLSSTTWQRVLKSEGLRLIQCYPFFLHAILAFTASHITCVSGQDTYAAIAMSNTHQALRLYGNRLHQAEDRNEMDALLAACFMLTALFYVSHDKLGTTERWIAVDHDPTKPHWLTVLSGPSLLIMSKRHMESEAQSIWQPFTNDSQSSVIEAIATSSGMGKELVNLLSDICTEYNISAMETQTNEYLPVLNALAPALRRHFDPVLKIITPCNDLATYVLLASFPSQLSITFRKWLMERDPITLLLVGFWFALLAQLEHCHWWAGERALREGREILLFFDTAHFISLKLTTAVSLLKQVFDT